MADVHSVFQAELRWIEVQWRRRATPQPFVGCLLPPLKVADEHLAVVLVSSWCRQTIFSGCLGSHTA